MPELLRKQVSARATRVRLLAWTISLAALPALAAVESLPASVRACAAETDSLRRLMCYDREVARFPAPVANAAPAPQATPTPPNLPPTQAAVTARVVSIERVPNEMVLHLDNGQVWQELQSVSGDLSLREGDTVKIDKHFGSYWLSGPHVSSMKVRQKS
jgi:hypothetical protein